MVFDNYNALGIGYGPGQKSSNVLVSIVAYPRWVTLFFLDGASLADPKSLLQGKGSQVRSIRLNSADDLDQPAVVRLIERSLAEHQEELEGCPRVKTVVKSIAAKRRARRP